MKLKSIVAIFQSLSKADIRYLVAGGLAVVAHGYVRFTADIDIILGMDEHNLMKAMQVFDTMGYKPRAPVMLNDFIYAEKRAEWITEKGLTVFSLWNPDEPATEVDIFVEPPIDFDKAYSAGVNFSITNEVDVKVLCLNDLVFIKRQAGRQKDMDDIDNLIAIHEEKNND